jgi:dipeptidyl aminopeptidase/acylaminoacyl peptidase
MQYSMSQSIPNPRFRWVALVIMIVGAFMVAVAPLHAQARRAVQLEDFYSIQTLGSPVISPDGAWVAYTRSRRIEQDNTSPSSVWLVATSGASAPRRVSAEGEQASRPSWDEGGRLTYVVDDMAYFVDPQNPDSEPEVHPALVLNRVPSPAGNGYAWFGSVKQAPVEPVFASDFERRHAERFEGEVWDHMYFQRDRQPMPTADPTDPEETPTRELYVAEGLGGAGRAITNLGLRPSGLDWHPMGKGIVFTADENFRDESSYGRSDIWYARINEAAAEAADFDLVRVTHDERFTASSPTFAPDGESIVYLRSPSTDEVIRTRADTRGPRDLIVTHRSGVNDINLTSDWDLQPGAPRWSPDGEWVYFTARKGGTSHLFRAASDGSGVEQVTTGERRLLGLTMDGDLSRIAYLVGRFDSPPEIFTADIDGANERQLTRVHDALNAEIAFQDAERIHFASDDGTEIEGWVMMPQGYDPDAGPYPLVVHSHGGPHSASGYGFNFKHQLFAAKGYMVLQTNFRGSTGYGEDFLYATWGAWGDLDGQDVMSGVDYVLENYAADRARVGTIGHSYGGFMSNWLITQYPDRFRAAVVGAGISNWLSDYGTADVAVTKETEFYGTPWTEEGRRRLLRQSPLIYAGRVKAATLFVHGEVDHRVPFEEGEQMYFALKKNGVPAKFILYADQSHGIRGHWNQIHRMMNELDWWETYLKPGGLPVMDGS